MTLATEPDFPAPSLEGEGASAGWFDRAIRHLFPRDPPAPEGNLPQARDDDDPDPPDLPPTWFLT